MKTTTFKSTKKKGDIYLLEIIENGKTRRFPLRGEEVRQLIQTLDNSIL